MCRVADEASWSTSRAHKRQEERTNRTREGVPCQRQCSELCRFPRVPCLGLHVRCSIPDVADPDDEQPLGPVGNQPLPAVPFMAGCSGRGDAWRQKVATGCVTSALVERTGNMV